MTTLKLKVKMLLADSPLVWSDCSALAQHCTNYNWQMSCYKIILACLTSCLVPQHLNAEKIHPKRQRGVFDSGHKLCTAYCASWDLRELVQLSAAGSLAARALMLDRISCRINEDETLARGGAVM